jgi:uncharacterized membrane protein YhaH (DUF805 family)
MAFSYSDLWQWQGRISRRAYLLAGFFGVALKYNLDRLISAAFFQRNAWPDYWRPLGAAARLNHLSLSDRNWLAILLVTALPFLYIGVTMTVRRLRDAGYPVWLVALFFVPAVNLLFFLWMCFVPSAHHWAGNEAVPWAESARIDELIPRSEWGSAILSVLLTAAIGIAAVAIMTLTLQTYGWSLFLGLPFCMGLFATLLHSYHEPRTFRQCLKVSTLPVVVVGIVLLAVAMEGFICLAMAAPIAMGLAALGGVLGYHIQSSHWSSRTAGRRPGAVLGAVLILFPAMVGAEHVSKPTSPTFSVRSSIEINAPPAAVWQKVIAFSQIPPPTEMIFRAGIAYPIRAEITGQGPGAIRRCEFSTGPFVEPIEVWDEPRLLQFGVTENPAPLQELSPYANVRPPHLHGYFVSHQGQFQLTELPNGRTRLEGTTWYTDAIWPAAYWHLWSDYIIHRIHMRVLEHIKLEVEASSR